MTTYNLTVPDGYDFDMNAHSGLNTISISSAGTPIFSAHGAVPTISQPILLIGQSTAGTAGAISTYLTITVNGVAYKIALYAP